MTKNDCVQCKLLAFLLDYPDSSWSAELADVREVVETVTDQPRLELLQNFLRYAEVTPLLQLQETYTSSFDLDPAASLHLTYHLLGDSEDRGKALAKLLWMYHREGYDAAIGELPDYLPMMLEFLVLCSEPEDATLLWSCLGTVNSVAEHLEEKRHPYAGLVRLVDNIIQPGMQDITADISKEV